MRVVFWRSCGLKVREAGLLPKGCRFDPLDWQEKKWARGVNEQRFSRPQHPQPLSKAPNPQLVPQHVLLPTAPAVCVCALTVPKNSLGQIQVEFHCLLFLLCVCVCDLNLNKKM